MANFESPEQGLRQLIATGTATGTGATTLTDTGKAWATGQWVGATVFRPAASVLVGSAGAFATAAAASIAPAFGQATTVGHLLVGVVTGNANTGFTVSGATGWVQAATVQPTANLEIAIWYKPNCAAGETAPTFNESTGTVMQAFLAEFTSIATANPRDQFGRNTGTVSPIVVTAGGNDSTVQDLVIAAGAWLSGANTTGAMADSAGFTLLADNNATSTTIHTHGAYNVLTAGATTPDSDAMTYAGAITNVGALIVSFQWVPLSLVLTSNTSTVLTGSGGWSPSVPATGFYYIAGTQVGEAPEEIYAKYFAVTHGDTLLENLVRTQLTTFKSSQLRESIEATVRKGLTDSGTSTGTAATTLSDTTKHWALNEWAGATAVSAGDTLTITSNTATVLTGTWAPAQPATGAYTLGFSGASLTTEAQEEELLNTKLAGWS